MPIKKLNRHLKHWQADLSSFTAAQFVELVKKLSSNPNLKQSVQQQLNIQHGNSQITGDLAEVEKLLPEVDDGDEPHAFNLSIQTNTNPRRTYSLSINFANRFVQVNAQNFPDKEAKQLDKIIEESVPVVKKSKTDDSEPATIKESDRSGEEVFLPGPFRPIPMPDQSDNDVFVIMSFSKQHRDAFFVAIEPTLKSLGFNPVRVDQIQHNTTVTPEIMRQIEKSVFIVADLTGEKPNVYYEVGYAHRANKEVILVSKKDTAVHFDVASINRIEYEDFTELSESLAVRVRGICDRLGITVIDSGES